MSEKISIYASQISNLTDARYFAARGVDWLGFLIDDKGSLGDQLEVIKNITEWVSGPNTVIEAPAQIKEENLKILYSSIIPSTICFDGIPPSIRLDNQYFVKVSGDTERLPGAYYLQGNIAEIVEVEEMTFYNPINSQYSFEQLLDKGVRKFWVNGGEEEKTGIKEYEELDEFFDKVDAFTMQY